MEGLAATRNVAMFLVVVLMNRMAVATETENSCPAVASPGDSCKETESPNKPTAPAPTKSPSEGTAEERCDMTSEKLWKMHKDNASEVFGIDFVQYLRNGTLCNGSDAYFRYKFYRAQDAFYGKAAAIATYFMEFHEKDATIKQKLQERRMKGEKYLQPLLSRIQEWKAEGWTEPSPVQAAIDYVSFDLGLAMNTSNEANVANAMASKAICVKLYRYIANTIARELECRIYSHPYKEWIDENFSPGLDDSHVSSTEQLFDLVASKLPKGKHCDQLKDYYGKGLEHEFNFFEAVEKCPNDIYEE